MKKLMQRIKRGLAPTTIKSVVMALGIGLVSTSWAAAPTPTIVWNGDFGITEKTGRDGQTYAFTLNPSENTGENLNTLSNGKVVIGANSSYGAKIEWTKDTSSPYTSVLVKYSGLTAAVNKTIASVTASQSNGTIIDCGVAVHPSDTTKLVARFNNNSNKYGEYDAVAPSGYLLMVYTSAQVFKFYSSSDGETWTGGDVSGFYFSDTHSCGVGLGGMSGRSTSPYGASSGVTIEAVAIFRGKALTTTDVTDYKLFYTSTDYKNWYYSANEVFTWTGNAGGDIGSSNTGSVKLFSPAAGEDTSKTYTCGGNTDYYGFLFWHAFCLGQTSYASPGAALRITSEYASKTLTAGFNPLTFGGLIVESGADGVQITGDSRPTILGAASGNKETWFGFKANASITRSGYLRFSGTVNLDVAKGKSLNISSADSPSVVQAVTAANGTSTAGGTLKMHGLGVLTVGTLTATGGATLDFSDVQEDGDVDRSTTPFITGNLTIDTTTKFVFPAGLAKDTQYKLCSGTLTGPSETIADIMVGTTLKKNVPLTFSGNSVSYGDSVYAATVDGSTFTWDAEEPETLDGIKVVFAGSGTVTGLSGTGTTISTTDNVTVDVTSFTSPTLVGTGTYRWTSGYPTTVPSGACCYEYVGGADLNSEVEITEAVTVNGCLKTSGYLLFSSGQNDIAASGSLDVLSGRTRFNTHGGTQDSGWAGGFAGDITVRANATFVNMVTDALHRTSRSNPMQINVYGTLDFGATRWTVKGATNYHLINLYNGGTITGSGQGANGTLDFEDGGSKINVWEGTATISAPLKFRANSTAVWIASGATLNVTTGTAECSGTFAKSGAGTLNISTTAPTGSCKISASEGAIVLDNVDMLTTGGIELSSASASPTLTIKATAADKVVQAKVSVPANTRGCINFEGAGTFALQGPAATSGSVIWTGTDSIPGTLRLDGDVTFNNGSTGANRTINKIGGGSGTLNLAAWSGCYDKDGNPGLSYTIRTIDADNYSGTIALANNGSASDHEYGCTFPVTVGNIIRASAIYGSPVVKITRTIAERTDEYENTIPVNVSSTTFNGNAAAFVYDDSVVGSEGIYLAEAAYNGVNYKTLAAAVSDAESASADPSEVTVYNASATIPNGYALVTAAGGAMTLRATGGDVYWDPSVASKDWDGATTASCTYYTSAAGTATTTFADGDTLVFASDAQIFMKAGAYGTPIKVANNATLSLTRAGDGGDYVLSGSAVTVESGSTLKMERYASNGWNSYELTNPDAHGIYNTTISGAGTFELGADHTDSNKAHGAAAAVLSGTSTIADTVTVKFADGATLSVPSVSAFSGSGVVTLDVSDVTLDASGVALITFTDTTPSDASKFSCAAVLAIEDDSLQAYPVAALTKADDSVVTYPTAQAAVNATPYNYGYKYVTIYQSNVSVTMVGTSLKLKLADGVTGVTVSNPFDEFAISSSTEAGVTTYTLANNPTVYTWDSGTSVGVWNSMVVAPWRYSKNDTPTQANRAPASGDNVIFASGASVTVGENISVDSITISAALTFTKSSSDVTITAASGGIVLTDAAASITVTGVTLSPAPTSGVEGYVVKESSGTYSLVKGATTAGVEIEANDAPAAIAKCSVALTEAQEEQGLEESYYTLVATPGSGDGKWVVTAVLDDSVAKDVAAGDMSALTTEASSTTATFTTTNTKAGLYYAIVTVDNPASPTVTAVLDEDMAGSDGATITLTPTLPFGSGSVLYIKWQVSDTATATTPTP